MNDLERTYWCENNHGLWWNESVEFQQWTEENIVDIALMVTLNSLILIPGNITSVSTKY